MGILLKLLSPLRYPAVSVHRWKSIWSESSSRVSQADFSARSSAPPSGSILFLLCVDILADPVHAILEGNGQKKAVLVARTVPRVQPGGDPDHLLWGVCCPGAHLADQGG